MLVAIAGPAHVRAGDYSDPGLKYDLEIQNGEDLGILCSESGAVIQVKIIFRTDDVLMLQWRS